eukprot:355888-Chlamydomonas_euryale.AAC.1
MHTQTHTHTPAPPHHCALFAPRCRLGHAASEEAASASLACCLGAHCAYASEQQLRATLSAGPLAAVPAPAAGARLLNGMLLATVARCGGTYSGHMCGGRAWNLCVGHVHGAHVWGTCVELVCGVHAWGTCVGTFARGMRVGHGAGVEVVWHWCGVRMWLWGGGRKSVF